MLHMVLALGSGYEFSMTVIHLFKMDWRIALPILSKAPA